MICNKCGCEMPIASKFCEKCGSNLSEQGASREFFTKTIDPALLAEQERQSKRCILGMILGIISIMLSFTINYYNRWYITLIYLIISMIGLGIGIIALIIGLKGKYTKAPFYIPALVLGIIGTCICGIKVIVDFNQLIFALSML